MDGIEIEIVVGASHPVLGIVTIEFGEVHLW
jgi:hypothetical protein